MDKDLEELIEEEDETDPRSLVLIKATMENGQEDDKDFMELLISKLDSMIMTWEQPWYQKCGSITRTPKADPDEDSQETYLKGIISAAEGEIIERNWKKFVETFDVPDLPKCFAKWRNTRGSSKSPNSPHEKVRHFVTAFLAQDLQRCLHQVFKYFIIKHAYSSKGPYTKLEEKVVLICFNFEPRTAAVTASYVLNRDPRTVYLKIEQFNKGKKEPRTPQRWTKKRATMLVNKLIQYSGLSLEQLRDKSIDHKVWAKIDEDMNQGIQNLKVFWYGKLHVQLFLDYSLTLSEIRQDLLHKLQQKQNIYKMWRDIRWKELVREFPPGCTAEFLYRIAERTFRKHKLNKLPLGKALAVKSTGTTCTRDRRLKRLMLDDNNKLVRRECDDEEENNLKQDSDDDDESVFSSKSEEKEENKRHSGNRNDAAPSDAEDESAANAQREKDPKKVKRRSECENGSAERSPRKKHKDKKDRWSATKKPRKNSLSTNTSTKKDKNHIDGASDCEMVSSARKNDIYKLKTQQNPEEERFRMFLGSTDDESAPSSPPKYETERHSESGSAARSPTENELKRRSESEAESTANRQRKNKQNKLEQYFKGESKASIPRKNNLKPPFDTESTADNASSKKQRNNIESTSDLDDGSAGWMVRLETPTIETMSQYKSEEESVASSQKKNKSKRCDDSDSEAAATQHTPAKTGRNYQMEQNKSLTDSFSKKKSKRRFDSENESAAHRTKKKEEEGHKRLLDFEFPACIPEKKLRKEIEEESASENGTVTKNNKLKRRVDSQNDSATNTPRKKERNKLEQRFAFENECNRETPTIETMSQYKSEEESVPSSQKKNKSKRCHDSEDESAATENTPAKTGRNNQMEQNKSLTDSSSKKKSKRRFDSENESAAHRTRQKEGHKRLLDFEFPACNPEKKLQKQIEEQSECEDEAVAKKKKLKRRLHSENESAANIPRKKERNKIERLLAFENECNQETISQKEIEQPWERENGSSEKSPRKKAKKKRKPRPVV